MKKKREEVDYYNKTLAHQFINIHSKVSKIEMDFEDVGTIMLVYGFEIYNGFHWNPFFSYFSNGGNIFYNVYDSF